MIFLFSIGISIAKEPLYYRDVLGVSEAKRDLVVEQYGDGADVFAVFSSIHGTESAGTPLTIKFSQYVWEHPEVIDNKTLLIVHLTNPDGVVGNIRGNRSNIDINRNFPTDNFGHGIFNGEQPLTAVESQIIIELLDKYQPKRVMVIHQPLNCIDFDGNSEALADHLSEVSGIRIKRLGSRSGSLGTYVGHQLGKEIITLELPSYASEKSVNWLWEQYGDLMISFVQFPLEK